MERGEEQTCLERTIKATSLHLKKNQDERLREHFAEVLSRPEPNEQAHILEADTDL